MEKQIKSLAVIFLFSCLTLVLFSSPVRASTLEKFDKGIDDFVDQTDQGGLDSSMTYITKTGDKELLVPAIALIPDCELKNDASVGLLASQLVTETIKYTVGKTRPRTGRREYKPFSGHKSFPSGHTTGAFSLATAIAHHYPDYKVYAYGWATLVAISRLYEDAHWASDVVVGAAVGHYTTRWTMKVIKW